MGLKILVVFVCSIDHLDTDVSVLNEEDALCQDALLPSPVRVSLNECENVNLHRDLFDVVQHSDVTNTAMDTNEMEIYGSRVRVDSITRVAEIEDAVRAKMIVKYKRLLRMDVTC